MAFKQLLFAYLLIILIVLNCFELVQNKSIYGIGRRVSGDQLLLKDVLQARPKGLDPRKEIKFIYSIPEPITYIEIVSPKNIVADVSFSYVSDIVEGYIVTTETSDLFEVLITIFGFNESTKLIAPSAALNHSKSYQGLLEPLASQDAQDDEELDEYEDFEDKEAAANGSIVYLSSYDSSEMDDQDFDFDSKDKVIEIGQRQSGDILLYQTYQSSFDTQQKINHSVIFYYIDNGFITHVSFLIFDHFDTKNATNEDYKPPLAEYSYFSPHSFKAVITDFDVVRLIVEINVYGFKPENVPSTYQPFIVPSVREGDPVGTEAPFSPLQRIKKLLNDCDHNEEPSDDLFIPGKQATNVVCPPTPCKSSASSITKEIFINPLIISIFLFIISLFEKLLNLFK